MRIFPVFAWSCVVMILSVFVVLSAASLPPIFSPSFALWAMLVPIVLLIYAPKSPLTKMQCFSSLAFSLLGMLSSLFIQAIFTTGVGGMKQVNENDMSQFVYWLFFGLFAAHIGTSFRALWCWFEPDHPKPPESEPPKSKSPESR